MPPAADPTTPAPRPSLVRIGLAVLAVAGALALVAATFSDVVTVRVAGVTRGANTGLDRHGPALLLLAAAVVVLTFVALRGSRVAGVGLTVLGIVVLVIAILADVPDLHRTGAYGGLYATATTSAGPGFYLETLGGALVVIAGAGLWLTGPTLLARPALRPRDAPQRGSRPPRQT